MLNFELDFTTDSQYLEILDKFINVPKYQV